MNPALPDPYLLARRRQARMRAVLAAVVLVGLAFAVMLRTGQQQAAIARVVAQSEAAASSGSPEGLRRAAALTSEATGGDDRAPAILHAQGAKAELAYWSLYHGSASQAARADELLEAAQIRGAQDAETALATALYEATRGDPAAALRLLDGDSTGAGTAWHAVARSEALLRSGDLSGARAALGGCDAGLCRSFGAQLALDLGDLAAAQALGDALVAATPDHVLGRTAQVLAAGAGLNDQERVRRLTEFMEQTALPPRQSALVVVALSRALRRTSGAERADELLERGLEAAPDAALLAREVARTKRYQGHFGAAWHGADKALRSISADPGLVAELAASLFMNDADELLDSRLEAARRRSAQGEATRRGEAVLALIRGDHAAAIAGLDATRHLGEPGDTDLLLAEAFLRAGRAEDALDAARRARLQMRDTFGEDSREAAIAGMYEALALGLAGELGPARQLAEAVYGGNRRTVWGAWLFGRLHEMAGDPASAKDAYLIACHNGQDFALACLSLAAVYDSLSMDELMRRTQEEARRHYLRMSQKGHHAPAVQAALGS